MKLLNEKITKFDATQVIYYSMVLIILRVDLIFLDNTPTGGDMGAHVVPIKNFIAVSYTHLTLPTSDLV